MSIKKDLLKKTKEYADYAKEHAKDYTESAREYVKEHAKDLAATAKDYAKDYTDAAKDKAKDYADNAKDYAKDYADDARKYAKDYAGDAKDYAKDYAKYAKGRAKVYGVDAKDFAKEYAKYAKKYAREKACGSSTASVAVALLGGLILGAALGILFAPEAGTETRATLGNSLQDLGNTVADKAHQSKEAIVNLKDKAVDAVKSKANEGDDDIDHPSFS